MDTTATQDLDRLAKRWSYAIALLQDSVEVDVGRRSGVPCLKGTRVTLAQIVAQVAEGESLDELCSDMSLDRKTLGKFFEGMAVILERQSE